MRRHSCGYILVNVNGETLYEHSLVAEKMLGRRLFPGEVVHHIDGDRANNDPSNLQVLPSNAHHHALHRSKNRSLQDPDEPNSRIKCECGCGMELWKYDEAGRPRSFIHGHNATERHPGNQSLRKCRFCQGWDNPDNLLGKVSFYHRQCRARHRREYYLKNRDRILHNLRVHGVRSY